MSTWNGWCARFGHPEVPHLALLNQILDGAGDIFNGHVGIDAMLIEQIDRIGPQPLQRCVGKLPDALRAAAQPLVRVSFLKTEFRCNHNLFAKWFERLADKFLVCKRTL